MTNAKGEIWSCSAAAIGRKTVITAGHCLYNHEAGGRLVRQIHLLAGINGENKVPFGGCEYDTAYVFEGFITEYKDSTTRSGPTTSAW